MIAWIQTHPAATGAVAVLTAFAIICASLAINRLNRWLDSRKAAPSELAGAPEGGNPTVGMPRFR